MPSTITVNTFSEYTLTEARAKILRKLRQTDTTRYSPDKTSTNYTWIDDVLNTACRKFAMQTKCMKTYAIVQLKAGYRTYRAPYGFADIAAAYLYNSSYENGYCKLEIKTVAELNNEYSDWRTKSGDDITILYVDRSHGTDSVLGFYPIPETTGDSDIFTSTTADEYEWACPLFANSRDYGMVIKDDVWKYILPNTDQTVVADLDVEPGNVLIEYYRLPMKLEEEQQKLEIPYVYQEIVLDNTVAELLENNPEDSAEFKRSQVLEAKTDKQVKEYFRDAKQPLAGRNLRAYTAIEGWVKNMDFRKGQF